MDQTPKRGLATTPSRNVGPEGVSLMDRMLQQVHERDLAPTSTVPVGQKKVMGIGGGTGTVEVMRAIMLYPDYYPISVCTMFDSGGNSGELRDIHGVLPPGDFRREVVVQSGDDEGSSHLRRLFTHRYEKDEASPLSGQVGGNLIYLMCERAFGRAEAVRIFPRLFKVRGEVLPVSISDATLCIAYSDGVVVKGEGNIGKQRPRKNVRITKAWLEPGPNTPVIVPYSRALQAAGEVDMIVFGPGSLFSSGVANLLVPGFVAAINAAKQAKFVFVLNLMNEPAETLGYDAADFVDVLYQYGITRPIDALLVNEGAMPSRLVRRYQQQGRTRVHLTLSAEKRIQRCVRDIISADLVSEEGFEENLVRHDHHKLGRVLAELLPVA